MKTIPAHQLFTFVVIALTVFWSCQDQKEVYEEFVVEGGIVYPGKARNAKVFSGRERVKVVASKPNDPTVTSLRVFWNFFTDSIVYDASEQLDTIELIIADLPESTYSFVIQTYDDDGNVSVPVELFGNTYGESYQNRVQNRPIISAAIDIDIDQFLSITFAEADISNGAYESVVSYTNIFNETVTVVVPVSEDNLQINDFRADPKYYTRYLPEKECIDTFVSLIEVIDL